MRIKEQNKKENFSKKTQKLIKASLDVFREEGKFIPIIVAGLKGAEKFDLIPFPISALDSVEGKNALALLMRSFVHFLEDERNLEVEEVVMITEVWYGKVDKDDSERAKKIENEGVKQDKDRQEGLLITVETKGKTIIHFYEIIKSEDAYVVAPEPEVTEHDGDTSAEARFQVWDKNGKVIGY